MTAARLRAGGMSNRTITYRCRPGGPWRRLLPGVVMLANTEPTRRQLLQAAMAYLGPETVISGVDALRAHGLAAPVPPSVQVLVPAGRRLAAPGRLIIERTTRMPAPTVIDGLPYASAARATLDAARHEADGRRLRRLLTMTLYHGQCTFDELQTELAAGSQRGSAAVRAELRRLGELPNACVHGVARRLVQHLPLPPPRWRTTVCDHRGNPLGRVDAWWDEVGMGWQLGPPANGEPDGSQRHLALTAAGVVLVRTSYERLRTRSHDVLRELASAFRAAARRPRPDVQCDVPVRAA